MESILFRRWSEWATGPIHNCDREGTYSGRLIVSGESLGRIVYLYAGQWPSPYFCIVRNLSCFSISFGFPVFPKWNSIIACEQTHFPAA